MKILFCFLCSIIFLNNLSYSQFTQVDSIFGSVTKERKYWDVIHYDLSIAVYPENKTLKGNNTITFIKLNDEIPIMQIDLQEPLSIDSVSFNNKPIHFKRITPYSYHLFTNISSSKDTLQIEVFYSGKPIEAVKAPWDGGIVWSKDDLGNHFIASACQGIGGSSWWPCKDHGYDEPDNGIKISVTTPKNLMNVSNGKLINQEIINNKKTTTWEVKNPINVYGINFNIGNYTHWDTVYHGLNGELKMDFFVLENNLEKAKTQFKDAFRMLEAFEHWFGPYPFYEDGYKIVETPYLGMEHQSSVTYGNGYQNGYLGRDISESGWGLKWDFIIIHESGHEWFGNSISSKDIADMWIHESFTSYSEALFTEYFYGKKAGAEYVIGTRINILNDRPIIGNYDVNDQGSYDMYYKGANVLHTIRQVVNNDEKWLDFLRDFNKTFYHQTTTTTEVENYISTYFDMDLSPIFNQYLRTVNIPKFETQKKGRYIQYKWTNCIDNFSMPIDVIINNKQSLRLFPTTKNQKIKAKTIEKVKDFYVD